jgi:hypothetical protein
MFIAKAISETKAPEKPPPDLTLPIQRDPRAVCEGVKFDLIWKRESYLKQIGFMQRIVELLNAAIIDAEQEIKGMK